MISERVVVIGRNRWGMGPPRFVRSLNSRTNPPIGPARQQFLERDMSYMVVYQRDDGSSGLEECSSLDVAVVAAERLRNVDAVEHPRIFRTEEIQFDFKPYYRVEVASDDVTTTETVEAPVVPVSVRDPASDASLDPWAAIDSPAPVDESDTDDESSATEESFSGEDTPEQPKDFSDFIPTEEDVSDAIPPRRGLFGR